MEREEKESKKNYFVVSSNYLLIILVGLLLIFSIVQAFQISSVKTEMKEAGVLTTAAVKTSGTTVTVRSAPSQPTMVGGC